MLERDKRLLVLMMAILTILPHVATAASMTGSLYLGVPSFGGSRNSVRVDTTVGTTGTGSARTIMLPADQWLTSGLYQRVYPGFPSVAQNTEVYTTSHDAVTFAPGQGAGSVSWCPQTSPCSGYTAGTVAQGYIGYTPGPNTFGGAFKLLRHLRQGSGAWFVFNPGTATPTKIVGFNANMQGVARTSMYLAPITASGVTVKTNTDPWPGGVTAGVTVIDENPVNLVFGNSFLGANGTVQTLGPLLSTGTFDLPDGFATGFEMTTGTISGSDATPSTASGGPFTFTTMGYDNRDSAGNGNIQLVGGGISYGGVTGNVFFNTTRLRMAVPEPGGLLALGVGGVLLTALYRQRRRS
ncbi:MAG: PEP-CTERM sorting domain-containing protein [Myxococcota bacterium]